MTHRQRSRSTRKKWQRLVSEQGRSGQTVTAFCRERGLCRPYFFVWKKRLRKGVAAKFLEVHVAEGTPGAADDPGIEVRLKNGRSLVVGRGFDADHLRALLAVVEPAR